MADFYRQQGEAQDESERQQSGRPERGQGGFEGRRESQRFGEAGYGSSDPGFQGQGPDVGYGARPSGEAPRSYRSYEDASQRYDEGPAAYGPQRYAQGPHAYGGRESRYSRYEPQRDEGGWRREFRDPAGAGYQGPQPGYGGYGGYGPESGYGRGREPDYGGYRSQGGYEPGVGWRIEHSRGGYGPSGERLDYAEYRARGDYGAGWDSGYGRRGGMRKRGPKGYKRSDERIREDLCERLIEADVDASDVSVDVRDGRVILQGSVPERWMKHRIDDMADRCFGVEDVDNNLRVVRRAWEGSPSGRAGTEYDADALNRCLRSELSAIETYRQALDRDRMQYGAHDEFRRLSEIQREHDDAAARLRQLVRSIGGEPSSDSGAWGTWSKVVMGAAKLFGDKSALKALKEGEESGLAEYQRYQREFAGTTEALHLTSELIERQQRHIRELDRLLAVAV